MESTETPNPTGLIAGRTVHVLRGSKYAGAWELAEVGEADENGYRQIIDTRKRSWFARDEDAFATEADAKAEAKARRAPRRPRQEAPLYGDGGMLVMMARGGRR